jgi:hypothetical protein
VFFFSQWPSIGGYHMMDPNGHVSSHFCVLGCRGWCWWISTVPLDFSSSWGKIWLWGPPSSFLVHRPKKAHSSFIFCPKGTYSLLDRFFSSSSIFIDMSPPPHLKLWLLYIRSGLSPYFFLFTAGRAGCEYLCCHGDPLCKSYTPQPRFGPKKKES